MDLNQSTCFFSPIPNKKVSNKLKQKPFAIKVKKMKKKTFCRATSPYKSTPLLSRCTQCYLVPNTVGCQKSKVKGTQKIEKEKKQQIIIFFHRSELNWKIITLHLLPQPGPQVPGLEFNDVFNFFAKVFSPTFVNFFKPAKLCAMRSSPARVAGAGGGRRAVAVYTPESRNVNE